VYQIPHDQSPHFHFYFVRYLNPPPRGEYHFLALFFHVLPISFFKTAVFAMIWFIAQYVLIVLLLTKAAATLQFNSTGWQYIKLDHAFEIVWLWPGAVPGPPEVTLQLFVYPDTQNYQHPALTIGSKYPVCFSFVFLDSKLMETL
jgi:hypothetical protein